MLPSSCAAVVCFCALLSISRGADATRPVDYTSRNAPFAPSAGVKPQVQNPEVTEGVQNKRVTPPTVEFKSSAVRERSGPMEVSEAREKNVREKSVQAPDVTTPKRSALSEKRSEITTATQLNPQRVSKYQESLVAASATNMARFPAIDRDTTAKLNRFVFRKNAAEPVDSPIGAPVTPAAGGGSSRK